LSAERPEQYASRCPRPEHAPWHGSAVLDDHHVAELGPGAEELPVRDDAAPDTRAEREHDEVDRAATGAMHEFRIRSGARIVLHRDRQIQASFHLRTKRRVAQRDVDRAERDALSLVDT